jgi:hypothetical protein
VSFKVLRPHVSFHAPSTLLITNRRTATAFPSILHLDPIPPNRLVDQNVARSLTNPESFSSALKTSRTIIGRTSSVILRISVFLCVSSLYCIFVQYYKNMNHPTLICGLCATDRFEPLPLVTRQGEVLSQALFVCQECSGVYFSLAKPEAPKFQPPSLGPPPLSTYAPTAKKR